MSKCLQSLFWTLLAGLAILLSPLAVRAQGYVVTDDDVAGPNTTSLFQIFDSGLACAATPVLCQLAGSPVLTTGNGVAAGDVAAVRQVIVPLPDTNSSCLFVSDAGASAGFPRGDIAGFLFFGNPTVLNFVSKVQGSANDASGGKDIVLAAGHNLFQPKIHYLYAAYPKTHTIATFRFTSQCQPVFIGDVVAIGKAGGHVVGMSVAQMAAGAQPYNVLVVAYRDGSIQSFDVSRFNGLPDPTHLAIAACGVGGVDKANSTGFGNGNRGMPAGADISSFPGGTNYAIFGDQTNAAGPAEIEVSAITPCASGANHSAMLAPTVDYGGPIVSHVNLGPGVNSQNVWLRPDQQFIYVSNNGSGQVTSVPFNNVTGAIAALPACGAGFFDPSAILLKHNAPWTTTARIQTESMLGNGGDIYVAETGGIPNSSSIGIIQANAAGCLQEFASSPSAEPNSADLLSITAYPLRLF